MPGARPSETSSSDDDRRAVAEILKRLRSRVEAVDDLRKVFKRFDDDRSGRISGDELRAVLSEAYHFDFTQPQFDLLMSLLDSDGDGTVDYVEFSRMLGEETHRLMHQEGRKMTFASHAADDDDASRRPPRNVRREDSERRGVVFDETLNEEHSAPRQARQSFIRRPPAEANEHETRAHTMRLQQVLNMLQEKITSQRSLRACFRTFDQNKDGFIGFDEFKRVIETLHLDLDDDDCMAIIRYCDKDFNGVLDYQEFCDKFAAQWSAGAEKQSTHRAVAPRVSVTIPDGERPQDRDGDGGGGGRGGDAATMGRAQSLADVRDVGAAHLHANAEKYSRGRLLSHAAAKHIQSQALGPGPLLADALCRGLHPVSFAPLLHQFRLADVGRSGFIPSAEFRRIIGEQLRMMNLSPRLAHNRYPDVDADTDKHGYVDYITFYDRIAVASSASVPDAVAVKPTYVRGYGGGDVHGGGGGGEGFGGDVVNVDTLAGFRKAAYARTPTVGHIPYEMATRGVSRNVLAERHFSCSGIAGYVTKGEGMESPGTDRRGGVGGGGGGGGGGGNGGRFDRLSGGRSGLLPGDGGASSGGGEGSMFSAGTSSAAGHYAAPPSMRMSGGGGGGRGVLQAALDRPGRHTHTKFPSTWHMTSATEDAPAFGDDDQRHYGHSGSGSIEDPHTGSTPRFPPGPKQQYTSRYEAKLERMRANEERVRESYGRADATKQMYEENRLVTCRQQLRRWRGRVFEQAEKGDATFGRDNFAVVRYGGVPDTPSHAMSEVVGGALPRPSFVRSGQLRHSEG